MSVKRRGLKWRHRFDIRRLGENNGDLSEQEFAALRALDTPTVCNAIEIVEPDRRLKGFTTAPLVCARPDLPPIVGYAVTATVRAMTTSPEAGAARATYLEYLAASSRPTIAIIHDIDPEPGFGAFWGEVNTAVHNALGCIGTVTNGSIRDLDECAESFQLLAGQIGLSHGYIHVVASNVEVTVAGMTVRRCRSRRQAWRGSYSRQFCPCSCGGRRLDNAS